MTQISRFDRARAQASRRLAEPRAGFQGDRLRPCRRGQHRRSIMACFCWRGPGLNDSPAALAGFRFAVRFLPMRQRRDVVVDRREHDLLDRRRQRLLRHEFVDHLCGGIGPQARWRAYFAFVLSGVAGWLANTATLAGRGGSSAAAGLARQGRRDSGKLCRELLALAFRRVSGARQARRARRQQDA